MKVLVLSCNTGEGHNAVIHKHLDDYVGREKRQFDVSILSHRLLGRDSLETEPSHSHKA